MSDVDLDHVTAVAKLYYLDRLTQDDLARRFNVSRSTISRLLKQAHDSGVVEIKIRVTPEVRQGLETEFVRRFGIERLLCAADMFDEASQRLGVASLVAAYLDSTLVDGMVVAVGMGRNVSAIADAPGDVMPRDVLFASAIGGCVNGGETVNADHIARRLAARFQARSETLYAPAIVEDPALRAALLSNDSVRRTLDKARNSAVALIGVGDMTRDSNLVRMGWLSPRELADARLGGTVGDIMGNDFIDANGRPSHTHIKGRVIALTMRELTPIKDVVVVASEHTKVGVLLAALRSGVVRTLATSLSVARAVLELDMGAPASPSLKRRRPHGAERVEPIPRGL